MATKKQGLTDGAILDQFVAGLRRTAYSPTIAGYRPMDHQKKFHTSMAKGRAFIGGNRSGKTVSGATEAIWWLTGTHPLRTTPPTPIQGRGVAVDFDHGVALIMLPQIAKWIPPSMLIDGSWEKSYSKSTRILTLTNGSKMEFLSTDQDVEKHAGTSRHFVWFDEEPPEDHYNENMLRLLDTGGSWWLTMTPVEGMSWTYDRIYLPSLNKLNPNIFTVTASTDLNIHINATEIDAYLAGMTAEQKEARRKGIYVQIGGLIYKTLSSQNILPDIINSDKWDVVRTKWQHFLMMDHGFSNPTCWLFGAHDGERIIIYDEYYVSGQVVSNHALAILEKVKDLQIIVQYSVGDPSIHQTDPIKGTSILMEYAENGVHILEGNNDVRSGINRVAFLFEKKKLFITTRCEKLLWELQRYRWAQWASRKIAAKNNLKEEPLKKDDHACDALRYGIASLPQFDYETQEVATNILNAPEVRPPGEELRDKQLISAYSNVHSIHKDPTLGSEW